jgi:hypothetical protein
MGIPVTSECLVRGSEGFADACTGLIVELADLGPQAGDDGFELSASLGEVWGFGDRYWHVSHRPFWSRILMRLRLRFCSMRRSAT